MLYNTGAVSDSGFYSLCRVPLTVRSSKRPYLILVSCIGWTGYTDIQGLGT